MMMMMVMMAMMMMIMMMMVMLIMILVMVDGDSETKLNYSNIDISILIIIIDSIIIIILILIVEYATQNATRNLLVINQFFGNLPNPLLNNQLNSGGWIVVDRLEQTLLPSYVYLSSLPSFHI